MPTLKFKSKIIKNLFFSILFISITFLLTVVHEQYIKNDVVIYVSLVFLVLGIINVIALISRFISGGFRSLKRKFAKPKETDKLLLSHSTHRVIDVKSWHDKNAASYSEIWIELPNNKEQSIRLTNSGIAVRKNHTITIVYNYGSAFTIFNHSTNQYCRIGDINWKLNKVTLPLKYSVLSFLALCMSLFIAGPIGFLLLLALILFLAKRKRMQIQYGNVLSKVNEYLVGNSVV